MGAKYAQVVIETSTGAETAATDIDYYQSFLLPGKWLVKKVVWVPEIAVTTDTTNYSVMTLTNVTASTTIATRSYLSPTFADSVAGTPEVQTLPTGLAAVISENDVLKLAKTTPGTGVAIRGKMVLSLEQAPLP